MSRKIRVTKSEKRKKIAERKKKEIEEKRKEELRKSRTLVHIPEALMEYVTYFRDDVAVKTAIKKYRNEIRKRRGGSIEVEINIPLKDGTIIEGELHADYRLIDFERIPPFVDKEDYTVGDLENRLEKEIPAKIRYELSDGNVEDILNDRELPEKIVETVSYTFNQLGYSVENVYISELKPSNTHIVISKKNLEKMLQRSNKTVESYLRRLIKEEAKLIKEPYKSTVKAIKDSEKNIKDDINEVSQMVEGVGEIAMTTQDTVLEIRDGNEYIQTEVEEINNSAEELNKQLKHLEEAVEVYKNNLKDSKLRDMQLDELKENAKNQYATELAREYITLNSIQDKKVETAITNIFRICLDRAERDGFSKDSLIDYIEEDELKSLVATNTYRSR